jgi:hypothetical protein
VAGLGGGAGAGQNGGMAKPAAEWQAATAVRILFNIEYFYSLSHELCRSAAW